MYSARRAFRPFPQACLVKLLDSHGETIAVTWVVPLYPRRAVAPWVTPGAAF